MHLRKGLLLKEIRDSFVVIDLASKSNSLITLNATSACIWKCVGEGKSEKEIVNELSRRFEAPEETVVADVRRFCGEMLIKGFFVE